LERTTTKYFAGVITTAQASFEEVEYVTDITPKRAILRIVAKYGLYLVLITELLSDDVRKYRYYVLRENWVEAGFDNSPDARAIRLKYGRIGEQHAREYVPHLHLENKSQLILTEEMTITAFVNWLKANIQPT